MHHRHQPNHAPTLETERLIIRNFNISDTEAFLEDMEDELRGLPKKSLDQDIGRSEMWRILSVVNGSWGLEGFRYWAVELKDRQELVGRVGAYRPRGYTDIEVGWTIFRAHRGNGYATESATAALVWLLEAIDWDRVVHSIPKGNVPSERLAQSLGAQLMRNWQHPDGTEIGYWETQSKRFRRSDAYRRQTSRDLPRT